MASLFFIFLTFFIVIASSLLFYVNLRIKHAPKTLHKNYNQLPTFFQLLPKLFLNVIIKNEGKLLPGFKKIPDVKLSIASRRIDTTNLKNYVQSFGENFDPSNNVPICYPQAMVFSLTPSILSLDQFPLSPLGIIHIRNDTTQYRPISTNDSLDFTSTIGATRFEEKGIEFDYILKAYLKSDKEEKKQLVWESTQTLLSRKKVRSRNQRTAPTSVSGLKDAPHSISISLTGNLGVKFARVSGDFNLQHLYPITAKIVGFKKPIIHGMWSVQKCLFEIQSLFGGSKFLDYPLNVNVAFKLPIYLPSKVSLKVFDPDESGEVKFGLVSESGELPHLVGSVRRLNE